MTIERYEGRSNKRIKETANKEFYNLHCSPDFVRVINLKMLRQMEHLACMGEINSYKVSIKRCLNTAKGTWEKNIMSETYLQV